MQPSCLFRLPCRMTNFLACPSSAETRLQGQLEQCSPLLGPPQVATAVPLHTHTPKTICPSIILHRKNPSLPPRPLLLLPAVATLPKTEVSVDSSVGARPSRLLEKEGRKTGVSIQPQRGEEGAQKGSWVLINHRC